LTVGKIYTIIL